MDYYKFCWEFASFKGHIIFSMKSEENNNYSSLEEGETTTRVTSDWKYWTLNFSG